MNKALGLAVMAAAVLAAGCTTTYASHRLETEATPAHARQIFGVVEGREFAKRVQVTLPAQLVVAEVDAVSSRGHDAASDRRSVQLADALAQDKASFLDVSPLFVDASRARVEDLRAAASRQHADLMLVTSMSERVEDEGHALGFLGRLLNILVLPAFLVPGETNDLKLHVRAAVIDVRNDLVYATVEDHREERIHATAFGERDAIEQGFDRLYGSALEKLRARVADRLRTLEGTQ